MQRFEGAAWSAGDYTGGNFQAKVKVNDRKVRGWALQKAADGFLTLILSFDS